MWDSKEVVIVSGGSRGLGLAIVEHLLSHQYIVATFSRTESNRILEIKDGDPNSNNFYWEPVDATNQKDLKKFVFNVFKKYGRIDGLINNAGATLEQLLPVTNDNEIQKIISLNIESVIYLTKYVTRIMLQKQIGSIINISSVVGHSGFKGTSVYSATKAALDGFSRSLARELGHKHIRVNSISPGFMATDMTKNMPAHRMEQIIRRTPLGRLGDVDDMVGLTNFLLSNEARFITGQAIIVDGGLTC